MHGNTHTAAATMHTSTPGHRQPSWLHAAAAAAATWMLAMTSLQAAAPVTAAPAAAALAESSPGNVQRWRLVTTPVAEVRPMLLVLQQELQQALQQPVDMYFDDAKPPQPLYQPNQPLIVLMSESSSILSGPPGDQLLHLDNLDPILVFFEMPWCLYAQSNSPLLQQTDVKAWIAQQQHQRSVHIGVSASAGQSIFWLRALSQATRAPLGSPHGIVPLEYRGVRNQEQVWRGHADMALTHCWQHSFLPNSVRLLATAQKPQASYLPTVPSFADLKLPPLSPSWFAAFVPKSTSPAIKAQVIQAFEQVGQSKALQQALATGNQTPVRWSHEQSRHYLENYKTTWQSVIHLLQWDSDKAPVPTPAPALSSGPARPAPATSTP